MEIIDRYYVVRHNRTGFATRNWPYPGTPVGWEDCDLFDTREEAKELLDECRKSGCDGHVAVLEVVIKNR